MRESSTVGWDSERSEFHFIADDPGPVLLVPPALLDQAIQQRDGSWLLRGYTQPDYSEWCEFIIWTPVYQLALSLLPPVAAPTTGAQEPLESVSEASPSLVGWVPAPPQPADASATPMSFYRARRDSLTETQPPDVVPLSESKFFEPSQSVDTGSYKGFTDWVITYVWTDPSQPDETQRVMTVSADSDATALRALHAEMRKLAEEPSYRVVAIAPASQVSVAA